jgi:outer membrane lipoprotein
MTTFQITRFDMKGIKPGRLLMFMGLLFLASCAPVLSDRSISEADRSLTFQELQKNPDAYKGKVVILGGKIISTTVKEKETWMEILQEPLDRQYKPEMKDISSGRFLVIFQGFLDPAIYAPGRRVTVAGEVRGKQVLPIREINYTYPVLAAREHYLLPIENESSEPRFHFGVGVGIIR